MQPLSLIDVVDTPEGEITARHYHTGEGVRITWKDGKIAAIAPAPLSPDTPWVAPALVDLQVNGYGGTDFLRDEVNEEGLLKAARALRRDGCARFLLTVITRRWTELMAHLKRIKAIRDGNPELRKAILGWHVEGPFISPQPGFVGAHDSNVALEADPSPEAIDLLKEVVGDDPTMITVGGERNGVVAAIRRARELGIVVSLGHTNASRCQIDEAVKAGAEAFTHLGNGCPQQLDRHDNILWRVLDDSGLTAGIIPDTHHVSPQVFRLMHRLLPADKIYWTTDAMSGAGAPPGLYTLGALAIEVGEDRVARQPGKQNFAGSALEPLRGICLGAGMLDKPWQAVWDYFSVNPARVMNRNHQLAVGGEAIFCLLKENG